jgi:hypothetical protein
VELGFTVVGEMELDVDEYLEEVGNDLEDVSVELEDIDNDLEDINEELEDVDVCATLELDVFDCGGVQPPITDGTALGHVVMGITFEPQLAACAKRTLALS